MCVAGPNVSTTSSHLSLRRVSCSLYALNRTRLPLRVAYSYLGLHTSAVFTLAYTVIACLGALQRFLNLPAIVRPTRTHPVEHLSEGDDGILSGLPIANLVDELEVKSQPSLISGVS